jgi:hypothetical protein
VIESFSHNVTKVKAADGNNCAPEDIAAEVRVADGKKKRRHERSENVIHG